MAYYTLREDSLRLRDGEATLLVGLPWYRSLPLRAIRDLSVVVDGEPVDQGRLRIQAGGGRLSVEEVQAAQGELLWFLQDRLAVSFPLAAGDGARHVAVTLLLMPPYLRGPAGGGLVVPVRADAVLAPQAEDSGDALGRVA